MPGSGGRFIHSARVARQFEILPLRQGLAGETDFDFAAAMPAFADAAPTTPAPDDVFVDHITFPATDGFTLAATLFLPRRAKRHAVLINSATAVPRKIYAGFARYLAHRGSAVLTYDYRGIGESLRPKRAGENKPHPLVGFDVTMADWASCDVTAAVAWMRQRYAGLPLRYVGHSFGGQALGLLPNNGEVARALLVAAQAGTWKLMSAPERYRVALLLNLVGMPLARALGYAPGRMGIGEDLPKGVFEQWTRWVMSDRYMFDDARLPALSNFAKFSGAMRALSFADDPWATRPAVEMLCGEYSSAHPEIVSVAPTDVGVKKIGHFGFFRPEHRDTLWRDAAEWLEDD